LADLTNEKFGAASQKVLIPTVVNMIRRFMTEKKITEESLMGGEVLSLLNSLDEMLSKAKLRADAQLLTIFANLRIGLEQAKATEKSDNSKIYDTSNLVNEILDTDVACWRF